MARLLKNEKIVSGSTAIQLPLGTTADRPTSPQNGQIRFNTDTQRFEIYYDTWQTIAINGTVPLTKDTFAGDGEETRFLLSKTPTDTKTILVFVGNVHQNPDDAYSLDNSYIVFVTPPPLGQSVVVYHGFASTDANA
jgi:hypothetical protein